MKKLVRSLSGLALLEVGDEHPGEADRYVEVPGQLEHRPMWKAGIERLEVHLRRPLLVRQASWTVALVLAGTVAPMAPGAEDETFAGRVWLGDDGLVDGRDPGRRPGAGGLRVGAA